jgi:hypothetical protein
MWFLFLLRLSELQTGQQEQRKRWEDSLSALEQEQRERERQAEEARDALDSRLKDVTEDLGQRLQQMEARTREEYLQRYSELKEVCMVTGNDVIVTDGNAVQYIVAYTLHTRL